MEDDGVESEMKAENLREREREHEFEARFFVPGVRPSKTIRRTPNQCRKTCPLAERL